MFLLLTLFIKSTVYRGEPIRENIFHISPAEGALTPKVNRNGFVHDFQQTEGC